MKSAECLCGCGEVPISGKYKRGHSRRVNPTPTRKTHGMTGSKIHNVWINIKQRCHNPNVKHFERYGGRGITVCREWLDSFESFYQHMGDPPEGTEIDRLDNDKGYEPGNCEWKTKSANCRNRRSTRWVDVDGIKMSMAEAAEKTGISYNTMKCRIKNNLNPINGERNK